MASNAAGPSADGVATTVHTEATDPYATMGQFSFAPATKTTVVTTTYTTTTTFPPLCVNAPGSLSERDPKDYPLAHVQAPESIRKFYFESGGELACFEEADAASEKVREVRFSLTPGICLQLRPFTLQPPCPPANTLTAAENTPPEPTIRKRHPQEGRVLRRPASLRDTQPLDASKATRSSPRAPFSLWSSETG